MRYIFHHEARVSREWMGVKLTPCVRSYQLMEGGNYYDDSIRRRKGNYYSTLGGGERGHTI